MTQHSTIGRSIIGLIALAAIVLPGCGGSNNTLSKSEYLKQANVICQKWEQEREEALETELRKYEGRSPSPAQREEVAIYVGLHPYEQMVDRFAELGLPKTGGREAEALVEAMEEAVSKLQANPHLVAGGVPFKKPNHLAGKQGLTSCET